MKDERAIDAGIIKRGREDDEGVQGKEEGGGRRWSLFCFTEGGYRSAWIWVDVVVILQRRSECASYFYLVHSEAF